MATIFSTKAINVGGREHGVSKLEDGSFEVKTQTPAAMGGHPDADATNPEELFALGYAACYHSSLTGILEARDIDGDLRVEVTINFLEDEEDGGFKISAKIEVAIEGEEEKTVQRLAELGHKACPYSKATAGNIDHEIVAIPY